MKLKQVESGGQCKLTLNIGVFFDGTENNKNNSELVSKYDCFSLRLGGVLKENRTHCTNFGFGGGDGLPDTSYGNDVTNVARLFELYLDQAAEKLPGGCAKASLRVYVAGVGTKSGGEDSLYSKVTGRGEAGVIARVAEVPKLIMEEIGKLRDSNPNFIIEQISFDIFGFSRGAAAARHFVNEALKGGSNILTEMLPVGATLLASSFSWRRKIDFIINFIGLFDTVTSIINPWEFDFDAANNENSEVNLFLSPDAANKVVHFVARDEIRHNFPLNSVGDADLILPGAHSDIGGGYLSRFTEKLILVKPCVSEVNLNTASCLSTAYRTAERDLQKWINLDLVENVGHSPALKIDVLEEPTQTEKSGGVFNADKKNVYASVIIERPVSNEISLVYMRIMRDLAVQYMVPFKVIDDDLDLPAELIPIYKKLNVYACGFAKTPELTYEEEKLLRQRYIHISAHWSTSGGLKNIRPDIFFINRPAKNNKRLVYR